MADQDAIDQFIAMPKDERGKLFEQLAPEKQQSLLTEIKKRKGNSQPAAPATPVGGSMRPLTENEQMETTFPVGAHDETTFENVHNSLRNFFTGAHGVIFHPIDTATNFVRSVIPAPIEQAVFGSTTDNPIQSLGQGLATRPGETLSTMAGQAAVIDPVMKAVGPATRALKDKVAKAQEGTRTAVQSAVGVGEKPVKAEVGKEAVSAGNAAKTTEEGNRAELAKHDKAVADAGQKDVNAHVQYLVDKAEADQANAAAKSVPDARAGLEKTVTDTSAERQKLIEKAEKDAKSDLDKRYEDQRELLGDELIPDTYKDGAIVKGELSSLNVGERTVDAYQAFQTNPDPTLPPEIKEIHSRAGENLGWRELQGIRSKLTKKLSSGKLNGEVYQGYKAALGVVDDGLQKIADNMGVGEQVRKNRADYAHYMQTFHDPISEPNTVARKTQTTTSPDHVRTTEEAERRAMLDVYDPNIGKLGGALDSLNQRLSSLPSESTRPTKTAPTYPEPTEVKPPNTNPIDVPEVNTRKIRGKLFDRWISGEEKLDKYQVKRLLSGGAGAFIGHIFGGGEGAAIGGVAGATFGPMAVAKLLDHPAFREWITRPPAGELETLQNLPYADRIKITDGLKKAVTQAQKQGITVDPRLATLVGVGTVVGPHTKRLRELADQAQ